MITAEAVKPARVSVSGTDAGIMKDEYANRRHNDGESRCERAVLPGAGHPDP